MQFGFLQTSPPIARGFVSKQVSPSLHEYPELPPQDSLHWEILGVGLGIFVGLGVGVDVFDGIGVFVGIGVEVDMGVLVGVKVGVFVGEVIHLICMGPVN